MSIKLPNGMYFTSDIKKEREKLYKFLSKEIGNKGPKLNTIHVEAINYFNANYNEIFRVTGLNTKFKRELDKVFVDVEYYAARLGGVDRRIRKFAFGTLEDGRQFIVFQQSMQSGARYAVIDVKEKHRYVMKSIEQFQDLVKLIGNDLTNIPLLINDPRFKYPGDMRKLLRNKLGA